jgi:hypothetical protein
MCSSRLFWRYFTDVILDVICSCHHNNPFIMKCVAYHPFIIHGTACVCVLGYNFVECFLQALNITTHVLKSGGTFVAKVI